MQRIGGTVLFTSALIALSACGGGDDPTGHYAGTLDGNYADMDAPGPDGTGMNRSFQFHEPVELVVSRLGDRDYAFRLGACSMSAHDVGTTDASILARAETCTMRLAGRGELTLSHCSATITRHADHAEVTFAASGPTRPDGMIPALNGTFSGERPR